jgi:replicative DNA helicase
MSYNQQYLEKPLPSSTDAERTVLGAILLDNLLIAQAAERLKPDDFYSPFHRKAFEAMFSLFRRSERIDPILIGEELKLLNANLDSFGGVAAITNLTYGLPHFTDISEYVEKIAEKAKIRELVKACGEITSTALDESDLTENVLNLAQSRINEICAETNQEDFALVGDLVLSAIQDYQFRRENEITHTGLLTGFRAIDHLTNGLQKSDFIVVGARPRVGKTSLLLNVAEGVAIEQPESVVVVFSLEMKKDGSLTNRLICSSAGVNHDRFKRGICTEEEHRRLNAAAVRFQDMKILVNDTPALSPMQVKAKSMMIKAKYGRLDLIMIDFLQKMSPSRRMESVRHEVGSIARELKNIAKELDVPVFVLSSLNRESETRTNKRPLMADLSESNAIESEADIVAFLYRESLFDPSANPFHAELIFAKNRNGEERAIDLEWIGEFTKFGNYQE